MTKCINALLNGSMAIEHIILLVKEEGDVPNWQAFTKADGSTSTEFAKLEDYPLYIATRSKMSRFVQSLDVRRARIEDHDDLVPLLEAQNDVSGPKNVQYAHPSL